MTSRAWRVWSPNLRPRERCDHAIDAGRGIVALALALLVASGAAACHGVPRLRPPEANEGVLGATTPGLSVAGVAAFRCVDTRPRILLADRPERSRRRTLLELAMDEGVEPDFQTELGRVIVKEFGCTRYTIEVAVPVPSLEVARTPVDMIEIGGAVSNDGGILWSIADRLRLSEREPFVYGTAMELSEDASISLRLDAKGSNGRIMLVYRLGL